MQAVSLASISSECEQPLSRGMAEVQERSRSARVDELPIRGHSPPCLQRFQNTDIPLWRSFLLEAGDKPSPAIRSLPRLAFETASQSWTITSFPGVKFHICTVVPIIYGMMSRNHSSEIRPARPSRGIYRGSPRDRSYRSPVPLSFSL